MKIIISHQQKLRKNAYKMQSTDIDSEKRRKIKEPNNPPKSQEWPTNIRAYYDPQKAKWNIVPSS